MKVSASKILRTSDFMEPTVEFGTWITIDGPMGGESLPGDFVDLEEVADLQNELLEVDSISLDGTSLRDYAENDTIFDIEIEEGYSAYLSAPGYLDRTENVVFPTEQEALDYLEEMFGDEE